MSDVKRYWMDDNNDADFPYECTDGDWVKYDDYARLKAEVERLRASSFVTAVPVEQYERLIKAGDAMADAIEIYRGWIRLPGDEPLREAFNRVIEAMKEGKPSV